MGKESPTHSVSYVIPGIDDETSGKIKGKDLTNKGEPGCYIDGDIGRIEYESDKGYQKIADKVVDISKQYLGIQNEAKKSLRKFFSIFFSSMIGVQLIFLIVLIILNSIESLSFNVSEYIITSYIISVFVETLGSIGCMLVFSFTSKEESSIVAILTTVIQNYQKYVKR